LTKRLAVIPARGGSKRLPRKNIRAFHGRPIIAYSISAALHAEIARDHGAEVAIRPIALSTDGSTVFEVCVDLLQSERLSGRNYDVLCCLYATSPLRTAHDVAETVGLIEPGVCDFAIAVTKYMHYPHQALRRTDDAFLVPMWPELSERRADRVGELLAGNGSTYCADVSAFMREGSFYGPRMRGYEMPLSRSIDIDTEEDFQMALALATLCGESGAC
jgi:pseudaminic acid cytidylyltransferase